MCDNKVVTLGFAEVSSDWRLRNVYFPSKMGAFPAWLYPETLPSSSELTCAHCKEPTVFLCQVYAPVESHDWCFHRTLYVFVCLNAACYKECSGCVRVFRCHMSRDNKYYSNDPPHEDVEVDEVKTFQPLCKVCGCAGTKHCGGCKHVNYCSQHHQRFHWKHGHKQQCNNQDGVEVDGQSEIKLCFPEYEIIQEEEELPHTASTSEKEEWEEYKKVDEGTKHVDDKVKESSDLHRMAMKQDKAFSSFKDRIEHFPDQIIRYSYAGEPLWVDEGNRPEDIPVCQGCGAERVYEMQIMPQMLNYLGLDSKDGECVDWGTLLIYTCSKNCEEGKPYHAEFIWKQHYNTEKK